MFKRGVLPKYKCSPLYFIKNNKNIRNTASNSESNSAPGKQDRDFSSKSNVKKEVVRNKKKVVSTKGKPHDDLLLFKQFKLKNNSSPSTTKLTRNEEENSFLGDILAERELDFYYGNKEASHDHEKNVNSKESVSSSNRNLAEEAAPESENGLDESILVSEEQVLSLLEDEDFLKGLQHSTSFNSSTIPTTNTNSEQNIGRDRNSENNSLNLDEDNDWSKNSNENKGKPSNNDEEDASLESDDGEEYLKELEEDELNEDDPNSENTNETKLKKTTTLERFTFFSPSSHNIGKVSLDAESASKVQSSKGAENTKNTPLENKKMEKYSNANQAEEDSFEALLSNAELEELGTGLANHDGSSSSPQRL